MRTWYAVLLLLLLCGFVLPAHAAQFEEVGAAMNLPGSIGGAWGDYDNDGYPDLYTGALWEGHRCVLWHNNGNGTFTDVTVAMGLRTSPSDWEDWGAAWGDFNNDGQLDLVVTGGNHNVFLYRNDGDHFADVGGPAAGFVYYPTARGAAWGDYDRDGWLDLYICYEESNVSRLYRNNRDGTFTEVTNDAGMEFSPAGLGMNASWADYNNDGWLDLVVARMQQPSGDGSQPRLYQNKGDGTFGDMGVAAELTPGSPNGVAWGDYDNDGLLDLYLGGNQNRASFLYHNNGNGTFTDVAGSAFGGVSANAVGVAWADYDNDGLLDLAQVNCTLPTYNGSPSQAYLFHNNGDGTFDQVAAAKGMSASREYRTAIWGDYDRDGKPDLYAGAYDTYSCLFHNTGPAGNWLRVRTLTDANGDATDGDPVRDALGARVQVNLNNDDTFAAGSTLQRVVDGGSSFCGQNEAVTLFGLGGVAAVAVKVTFPDGSYSIKKDVAANQEIAVPDLLFSDVPEDFWAHAAIDACYDAGIVTGYKDTTYQPKWQVTRGQMAAFIARAMCGGDGLVPSGPAEATFADVPVGSAFFRHVEYAFTQGVVKGYKDGTYQPTWSVNRGQMAAFLARALVGGEDLVPTGPATANFTDVPPSFPFYNHIEYIYHVGVTTGYSDHTFHPEYACNRDQMAVFVARAFALPM